jgi:hypothetical protein
MTASGTALPQLSAVVPGQGARRAAGTAQLRSLPQQPGKGRRVMSSERGKGSPSKFGEHSVRAAAGIELGCR